MFVMIGSAEFVIRTPHHEQAALADYKKNLAAYRSEVRAAVPVLGHLTVDSSLSITPQVATPSVTLPSYCMADVLDSGMSEVVYKCYEQNSGQVYAAKCFSNSTHTAATEEQLTKLYREASFLKRLTCESLQPCLIDQY